MCNEFRALLGCGRTDSIRVPAFLTGGCTGAVGGTTTTRPACGCTGTVGGTTTTRPACGCTGTVGGTTTGCPCACACRCGANCCP